MSRGMVNVIASRDFLYTSRAALPSLITRAMYGSAGASTFGASSVAPVRARRSACKSLAIDAPHRKACAWRPADSGGLISSGGDARHQREWAQAGMG